MNNKISIAIHGGAGTILPSKMTPKLEVQYREALKQAVFSGYKIMDGGGTAVEAVEKATILLENNPLLNAGKGSVYTNEGKHEMDASIMDGSNLECGSVAGVKNVKNPISLARKVMQTTSHNFLIGEGALDFAKSNGLEIVPDEYFHVEFRKKAWMRLKDTDNYELDHSGKTMSTVGAVAKDTFGNLAAATSTGGVTNKKKGRVGDSPIIGSGTYAFNPTCAVSLTGDGEYIVRIVAAYDVSCLMEYKGMSLQKAAALVIQEKLKEIGGEGGLIAVDHDGNVVMEFNSPGMYRASMSSKDDIKVGIYRD